MEFVKMHGLGNDFILFPLLQEEIEELTPSKVHSLCRRSFGIGADGILLLLPPERRENDYRMRIFNRDGSEASMCGNGIRCFGHYLSLEGLMPSPTVRIETEDSVMILTQEERGIYSVDMGAPSFDPQDVPLSSRERIIEEELEIEDRSFTITSLRMGTPHTVIFVEDVQKIPLTYYGPLIERAPLFLEGTNVEFVSILSPEKLRMRVWERGVGVTKACGTGACAAFVAGVVTGRIEENKRVTAELDGGQLILSWLEGSRVMMTGPAKKVYHGYLDLAVF